MYNNFNPLSGQGPEQGGGPMVSGIWMNQKTGEEKLVRDVISGPDQTVVLFSDQSSIPFSEFSALYVQVEDNPNGSHHRTVDQPVQGQLLGTTNNDTRTLDTSILFAGMGKSESESKSESETNNQPAQIPELTQSTTSAPVHSKEQSLVTCLFERDKNDLIDWSKIKLQHIPVNAIYTLIDYFGVTEDDVVDVIVNNILNKEKLHTILKQKVSALLKEHIQFEDKPVITDTLSASKTKAITKTKTTRKPKV